MWRWKYFKFVGFFLAEHVVPTSVTRLGMRDLVERAEEQYQFPGKLTLELVLANQKQNKLLCLWTMQLTKWAGKVPYLLLLKCFMDKSEKAIKGYWHQSNPGFESLWRKKFFHKKKDKSEQKFVVKRFGGFPQNKEIVFWWLNLHKM